MTHEAKATVQAAFDAGPAPVEGMRAPETLPRVKAPTRRLVASDLDGMLTRAKQEAAAVERAVASATAETERIDTRWTEDARRLAADEHRNRAAEAAGPHLKTLRELVGQGEAQRPLWSPAVLARLAVFSPDPAAEAALRQSWTLRAAGADAAGLQALALLAASGAAGVNGVALGVVVADELRRRADVGAGDRRAILDLIPLPESPAELATVQAVRDTWRRAEWALAEFQRPGSTRTERLQTAFDKSKVAA